MIAYLLLSLITYSTAYPFNSTECTECIEVFNYIHSHNDSLGEMIDDFNHVCRELNISGCENITRFADKVLMTNSTEICEFLDICDNLDLDNSIKNAYFILSANCIIDLGRRSFFLYIELKFILAFASLFKSFKLLSLDLLPRRGFLFRCEDNKSA